VHSRHHSNSTGNTSQPTIAEQSRKYVGHALQQTLLHYSIFSCYAFIGRVCYLCDTISRMRLNFDR
jgi:hypothetical protein